MPKREKLYGLSLDYQDSQSANWVDYDADGDLDLLVVNNNSENNFLYRNNTSSNSWISITCSGSTSNAMAIGARVKVTATIDSVSLSQIQEIATQSGLGGQNGSLNDIRLKKRHPH